MQNIITGIFHKMGGICTSSKNWRKKSNLDPSELSRSRGTMHNVHAFKKKGRDARKSTKNVFGELDSRGTMHIIDNNDDDDKIDDNGPDRHYFFNKPLGDTFGIVVIGYLRLIFRENFAMVIPKNVRKLCIQFYGAIHGNIVVKPNEIKRLKCPFGCNRFEFDSILIKKGGILTTNKWNNEYQCGGSLHIICFGNIIIEETGCINLSGKGYSGGLYGRCGESYQGKSANSTTPNYGGGGGAGHAQAATNDGKRRSGGGGGYGTHGYDGQNNAGSGGETYGDKKLNILHLGSGGGGSIACGGSGGGAIKIQCFGSIILKKRAKICCNGTKGGYSKGSGTGSGGSIHIILNESCNLEMHKYAAIEAIGGYSPKEIFGEGGDGRIRIQFLYKEPRSNHINISDYDINPTPYVG